MKRTFLLAALMSSSLAAPALARDGAWYVGIEGGGLIVQDTHFRIFGAQDGLSVHHKVGYDVDGILGYDFGRFRIEGEVAKKHAAVDTVTNNTSAAFNGATGKFDGVGVTGVFSVMGNALFDSAPTTA